MSTTDAAPMDFAEFGHAFAQLVLVPEVIGPRLEALLPSEIKVTEDIAIVRATVRGSATVEGIEDVQQEVDEALFLATGRRARAVNVTVGQVVPKEDHAQAG